MTIFLKFTSMIVSYVPNTSSKFGLYIWLEKMLQLLKLSNILYIYMGAVMLVENFSLTDTNGLKFYWKV